jgi:parallel beta-helix repeat protein
LFGQNSQVYFVDPATGGFVVDGSGHTSMFTVAAAPQYSPTDKTLTVTVTSPTLQALPAQAMMYATDLATRGDGLIIESNDISSNRLARGIALSGQTGVTIQNNTLSGIQEAGILCGTDYSANPKQPGSYSTYGPMSNIFILHNHLHRANIGIGSIGITMLAAIQILTINLEAMPATAEADANIYILNNEIDATPRTGIWVMNTGSGEVSNNRLHRWGYDTTIPNSTINSGFPVTSADFGQPLVIWSSSVSIGTNQQLRH